nr:hypothetical protein [Tanacetum cinerariifolium]
MPFMKEGGSVPKILSPKYFVIPDRKLTTEDGMAQVKEMKRLADLKDGKEKSEKSLQIIMNPATIKARAQKMAEYKAKIKKMLDEYNHQISHRVDQLPITKISYRVNSSKEASLRITRGNDPLNLTIYEKFRLKTLEFSEWLEVHALASKSKGKSTDLLLQSLIVKFHWVLSQAKALGIPPPPELSTFGGSINEKKRKKKLRGPKGGIFFYNGNFDLLFQREEEFHLATTAQMVRLQSPIYRGTPEKEELFKKMELTKEARIDVSQARKIVQDNLDGLSQHIRIQVKGIVKEVEDYLKTYSSSGKDISWYVEGKQPGSKESRRWQYFDYHVTI